jgi:two-component system chemotaxis response regulator CheY
MPVIGGGPMSITNLGSNNGKVLIVDDVPSARKVIVRLLAKLGVTNVVEASSGEEALAHLGAGGFELVISDWNMPELDGLQLLAQMRQSTDHQKLPFILITSSADRDEVVHAFKAGISDYIVKPFNGETLAKKVDAVLGKNSSSKGEG